MTAELVVFNGNHQWNVNDLLATGVSRAVESFPVFVRRAFLHRVLCLSCLNIKLNF